jgi:precorrin-2 dehydrogenase/sirohydrochlorin ferrochelatase
VIGEPPLLPVFFKMSGRSCLVVGGGNVALEKIRLLLESQSAVCVVASKALPELQQLARDGKIVLRQKEYEANDLAGSAFVIAATNDSALNHRVYADAQAQGRLVNVVDDPQYCDFYFGSIVRRGALQIGISTSGESPAFAQQLKQEIDQALPPDTDGWLARLGEMRRRINQKVPSGPERVSLLRELARRETCELESCPCRTLVARDSLGR